MLWVCIELDFDASSSMCRTAIRFAVFDRGLGRMCLPILSFPVHDNASPSSSPQRQERREIAEEDETELVYKYFDVIGIIEGNILLQGRSIVQLTLLSPN